MKKKIGIFIFIVICSTVMLSDWVERIYIGRLAGLPGRYNSYVGIQKEQKDSIDLLVLGDSESMTSISPMELWKSTGITSYIWNFRAVWIWSSEVPDFLEFACQRISASRFLQRHVRISGNDGTLRLVSGSRTISFIRYLFPRRPESGINLRENISKGILENMWREWELQQWHFSRYGSVMVCGTVRNGITFFTDYITLD